MFMLKLKLNNEIQNLKSKDSFKISKVSNLKVCVQIKFFNIKKFQIDILDQIFFRFYCFKA